MNLKIASHTMTYLIASTFWMISIPLVVLAELDAFRCLNWKLASNTPLRDND